MTSELRQAGLYDLESASRRDFDWFEPPNERRGGWSGVSRMVLNPHATTPNKVVVFLKIQQNHFYVSRQSLFRKRLTYSREFAALSALGDLLECLPEPVYYAEWMDGKNRDCMLLTRALDGWISFDQWINQAPSSGDIYFALEKLAETLREIHHLGWAHFGMFQKHVFLKWDGPEDLSIKLIDWEKARRPLLRRQCVMEDVSRFLRHSENLSIDYQKHFLHAYFQTENFTAKQRRLIRKMRGTPEI